MLSLYTWTMKGALRFMIRVLPFSLECFATATAVSTLTVKKKPWKQTHEPVNNQVYKHCTDKFQRRNFLRLVYCLSSPSKARNKTLYSMVTKPDAAYFQPQRAAKERAPSGLADSGATTNRGQGLAIGVQRIPSTRFPNFPGLPHVFSLIKLTSLWNTKKHACDIIFTLNTIFYCLFNFFLGKIPVFWATFADFSPILWFALIGGHPGSWPRLTSPSRLNVVDPNM